MSPVNVSAIGAYIREQREQARISLRQLAQAAGVSNPYLSQIERGLRRPSADILQQIAKALRISAEALYVQAGFLEDRPPGSGVRDAVLTDPDLNERQKQMLIEIYESFRKEAVTTTVQAGPQAAAQAGPSGPGSAASAPSRRAVAADWERLAGQARETSQETPAEPGQAGPGAAETASWPWADADAGPDGTATDAAATGPADAESDGGGATVHQFPGTPGTR